MTVRTAAEALVTRFDRLVEFVNFLLALAIMAAAWTLVVEALAFVDRHGQPGRRSRHVR